MSSGAIKIQLNIISVSGQEKQTQLGVRVWEKQRKVETGTERSADRRAAESKANIPDSVSQQFN